MKEVFQTGNGLSARRVILVAGMHRSGTSALAGALRLLGVAAPKTLVPPHPSNPSGHWECAPLVELHEKMLVEAGSSHLDWRALSPQWFRSKKAAKYREQIKQVVLSEFDGEDLFFIKDPRICRFLSFTLSLMRELRIQPFVLLPIRNPLEVARSIQARNNLPLGPSFLIWLRHALEAEYHSRSVPRFVLRYDTLLADPRGTLALAGSAIGMRFPLADKNILSGVDEFLQPNLRHQKAMMGDLQRRQGHSSLARRAYELLLSVADDASNKDSLRELDTLRNQFDEACRDFEPAVAATAIAYRDISRLTDQIRERDDKLVTADRDLRRLLAEIEERDQHLIAAKRDADNLTKRTEQDILRLIAEVKQRDEKLIVADIALRRLIGEAEYHNQRLSEASGDLRRLTTEIEDRDSRLVAADGDLRRLMGEIEDRERQLSEAGGDLLRLTTEIEDRDKLLVAADGNLRRLTDEIEERERRLLEADGYLRHLSAEIEDRDRGLGAADGDLRRLMGDVEDRERRLLEADGYLRHLSAEIEERDRRLVAADGDLRRLTGEVEDRERRLSDADGNLRHLVGEIEDRDRRLVAADGDLRRLMGEIEDRERRLSDADHTLSRLTCELEEREQRLVSADADLRRLLGEIADRTRQLSAVEQRLRDIEESRAWRAMSAVRSLFR